MKYNQILKALIGIPQLSVKIDNPFPLVGENVSLHSLSKWVFQHSYALNDGNTSQTITKDCTFGQSSETLVMESSGEYMQAVSALNSSGSAEVKKVIYPMSASSEPYFNVRMTKEIIRNDGEITQIQVIPEHGYTGAHTVAVRIYKENDETTPVLSFTNTVQANGYKYVEFSCSDTAGRGIYDVEVDVIDTLTGVTFIKRINKLITITPKLAPRNEAIEYLIPDAKIVGGAQTWIMKGSDYPAGCTIVLKYDPKYGEKYPTRLRLEKFKGTWDNPIIFTIDSDEPFEFNWFYWYGIYMDGCEHVVFDGRGYKNLTKGFKMIAMPEFANAAIQAGGLSHELEFFEIEIDKADFAGFQIKTDPDKNNPATWHDNFKFNRLLTHHCYVHDTLGEGMYLGYFGTGWKKEINDKGEEVLFRAHHLYNCRIYRNDFINQGYDSFQMNNAVDADICYNKFINGGLRMEKDQTSGLSISVSGKIYNNIISDHFGPGMQFGHMGKTLEIFNNLICNGDLVSSALLGFCNAEPPTVDESFVDDNTPIIIHNNILMSYGVLFMCRNTNQWKNVTFVDNFCVYKGSLFGGQTSGTIAGWVDAGNIEHKITRSPYNYNGLDLAYKFGDSESCDYRIANNSPLSEGGTGKYFKFDYRGYKNWFSKTYPVGPYMGIYKNPAIVDADFALLGIVLNGGTPSTLVRTINIELTCKGIPTKYRIGETVDLSGIAWVDMPGGDIPYLLSDGYGAKIVYVQISNGIVDSTVKSGTITYQASPLALDSISLSGGYNNTTTVVFNYSGTYIPTKYRIGEASDISDGIWTDYSESIQYVFNSPGDKTLYGQLQDVDGNISEIKSANVTVVGESRMAVISLGWTQELLNGAMSQWDENMKLTKIRFWGDNDYYWTDGGKAGTVYKIDSFGGPESSYFPDNPGVTTGDNSGPYPDVVLEKFVRYNGNPTGFGYRDAKISIPPGRYKIRLFCSITNARNPLNYTRIQTVIDGVETKFNTTGFSALNNADVWLEQTITVPASGEFNLQWGLESPGGWIAMPLNIIEIEEI